MVDAQKTADIGELIAEIEGAEWGESGDADGNIIVSTAPERLAQAYAALEARCAELELANAFLNKLLGQEYEHRDRIEREPVVKALEWVKGTYTSTDDDGGPMEGVPHRLFAWSAEQYLIIRQRGGDGRFILRGKSDGVGLVTSSLDAAKAAAQADYESRILLALASREAKL